MIKAVENSGSEFVTLLGEGEEWLMERILHYAHQQNYTQYTSTLLCAWQLSIAGLTSAIIEMAQKLDQAVIEFEPDTHYEDNPLAAFAVTEALKHRERGVNLGMFLGLLKYYRQAYLDLAQERVAAPAALSEFRHTLHRCFDLFEIALVTQWISTPLDKIIDELSAANRAITNEKNFYLTAYESLVDPAFLIDEGHHLINLNAAALSLLSGKIAAAGELYYQQDTVGTAGANNVDGTADLDPDLGSLIGQRINDVLPNLAKELSDSDQVDQTMHREVSLTLNGQNYEFLLSQSGMCDVSGKFSGWVVFLTDISDRKILEDELRALTLHDPLTGVGNRRHLNDEGEREFKRARRMGAPLSVIAADIDLFKKINDALGHHVGDLVLIKIAEACVKVTREYDIVARTGGEEFVVLLPHTTMDQAVELAQRMRTAIALACAEVDGHKLTVSASMGVAKLSPGHECLEQLFDEADSALYCAKREGRDRIVCAGPTGG